MKRCDWAKNELSIRYHDTEWGVPLYDDQKIFEFIILEGAQAGLSWDTILRKRENYRAAFNDFDPIKVAQYDDGKVAQLLTNEGIIRNRLKIAAAITNAKAFLNVQEEFGSFQKYVWEFVDGEPITNSWTESGQVPATSEVSDALSEDLKNRGFKFVGSTIMYAHMQATGLVNDHLLTCFRYDQC
jgi:DNA-3-methyladenine glycosylase I